MSAYDTAWTDRQSKSNDITTLGMTIRQIDETTLNKMDELKRADVKRLLQISNNILEAKRINALFESKFIDFIKDNSGSVSSVKELSEYIIKQNRQLLSHLDGMIETIDNYSVLYSDGKEPDNFKELDDLFFEFRRLIFTPKEPENKSLHEELIQLNNQLYERDIMVPLLHDQAMTKLHEIHTIIEVLNHRP